MPTDGCPFFFTLLLPHQRDRVKSDSPGMDELRDPVPPPGGLHGFRDMKRSMPEPALREIPLFAGLSEKGLVRVSAAVTEVTAEPG